jgi:hypothetical protein
MTISNTGEHEGNTKDTKQCSLLPSDREHRGHREEKKLQKTLDEKGYFYKLATTED